MLECGLSGALFAVTTTYIKPDVDEDLCLAPSPDTSTATMAAQAAAALDNLKCIFAPVFC